MAATRRWESLKRHGHATIVFWQSWVIRAAALSVRVIDECIVYGFPVLSIRFGNNQLTAFPLKSPNSVYN